MKMRMFGESIVDKMYRICHELTVEIKLNYIKRVLRNVIKRAFIVLSQQSTNVRYFLSHN